MMQSSYDEVENPQGANNILEIIFDFQTISFFNDRFNVAHVVFL